MFWQRNNIFPINLWSTVQHNVFFHEAVTNDSNGWLNDQTSQSYVGCYTSSKTIIHQIISKRKRGVNGGSEKGFFTQII